MTATGPIRVLALLEATSVTGTAKAALEVAFEARAYLGYPRFEVTVAYFLRGDAGTGNALTRALEAASIPFRAIRESSRFDASVLPQIRDLARQTGANLIWTNSVKSHYLVHRSGIGKKVKWVAFHHGYTSTDLKMRFYNQLDRLSLRHAARVVTVCKPFASQMERRGVPDARIRVQHMPIRRFGVYPEQSEKLRLEFNLDADAKIVLCVGRLSHEKGHKDLVVAFAKLKQRLGDERLRLVLVGDGPERKRLEQQSADENIRQSVIFAGQREDAKSFYGIANVFALPSYTEGTPNVLLEAMAADVPVVATSVGGVPELAVHERSALLIGAGQPSALADALMKVLQSTALRNELAAGGQQVVEAHTPRAYFNNMRAIFLEAIAA